MHLSDIHLGDIHQKGSIIKIVNEIQDLHPDIVVITGDLADGSLKVKHDWLMPLTIYQCLFYMLQEITKK